jgi:putative ABC transport system substrate-binding protein
MTNVGDAVGTGIVASLARPGGNITGDTFFVTELVAKRLELLRDAIPRLRRVAVLANPDNAGTGQSLQAMEIAAKGLNVALLRFNVRGPADLDGAFAAMAKENVDALAVIEDAILISGNKRIAELAVKQRLPSISFIEYADAGGLFGYGPNILALYRRAAAFVDKILKGAKPSASSSASSGTSDSVDAARGSIASVTLSISAEQARQLAEARRSGELDILLLPPSDVPPT